MNPGRAKEIYRAERIIFTIGECNEKLDSMYEMLVDKEYESAKAEAIELINQIKDIIKSIDEDDF